MGDYSHTSVGVYLMVHIVLEYFLWLPVESNKRNNSRARGIK